MSCQRSLVQLAACCALASGLAAVLAAQNSMRKERPAPSALAARAGSAVQWRESLDAAIAEGKEQGRPVFWYVPTVQGSPMDRKAEIDRYLLAGPFSWPAIVGLLNERFVPVRGVARGAVQKERKLLPRQFIEPGFLVLAPDGSERLRIDKLTTLHPAWFEGLLAKCLDAPRASRAPALVGSGDLAAAWAGYRSGDLPGAERALTRIEADAPGSVRAEAGFLRGAILHRSLRAGQARDVWLGTAAAFPDEPLAWKCAAEAEGHGPFALGFEDFLELPAGLLGQTCDGSRAPPGVYDEAAVTARSLAFLRAMQQPDGGYADSRYDFGGTDGLPNVWSAVTALVGLALLEHEPVTSPALERVFAHASDPAKLSVGDRDEIVWARIYRVRFFTRWLERRPDERAKEARAALQRETAALLALPREDGSFFHEYPNPFASASALLALARARAAGEEVTDSVVQRAVAALVRCRLKSGAFSYGQVPEGAQARATVPSAAGRMPLCELALAAWGASDQSRLEAAIEAGFEHHEQLESTRKYDDHAPPLAYGGFFFWYDVHARVEAILSLPAGPVRERAIARQREQILAIPEIDGCFTDSHELGRVYGTATALLCLARLAAK